jgi:hypothetical protein
LKTSTAIGEATWGRMIAQYVSTSPSVSISSNSGTIRAWKGTISPAAMRK